MQRNPDSHKGENGKVAVIGGSEHMHGAPIFSALAAEASGADLIHMALPLPHQTAATNASLNFQVFTFRGNELRKEDTGPMLQMLAIMDCAVIGPGLSRHPDTLYAIEQVISGAPCPLVIDATALQSNTLALVAGRGAVLTPHLGELERMAIPVDEVSQRAKVANTTFLLKGVIDKVTGSDGETHEIAGGNAGLTVGGTGDALAGLVAGLIAQQMSPVDAAILASRVIKTAGDQLFQEKGFRYTTHDVIELIPYILHEFEQAGV